MTNKVIVNMISLSPSSWDCKPKDLMF